MNKATAFQEAKRIYPGLKPTRIAGFTHTDDGKGLILTGYDEYVSLVIYNRGDLWRLKGMVDAALERGRK